MVKTEVDKGWRNVPPTAIYSGRKNKVRKKGIPPHWNRSQFGWLWSVLAAVAGCSSGCCGQLSCKWRMVRQDKMFWYSLRVREGMFMWECVLPRVHLGVKVVCLYICIFCLEPCGSTFLYVFVCQCVPSLNLNMLLYIFVKDSQCKGMEFLGLSYKSWP